MSQLFVDDVVSKEGTNSVGFSKGISVSVASTFSGDVSIGGTLTYEDVTNVDVVGLITARGGIKLGVAGIGGTVFSDNIWAEYKFYGMNFFEVIAVLTDQFMLPLGGLLICILVGFCVPKLDFIKEIDLSNNLSNVFNVCLKFVAPVSVLLIFGYALS